MRAVGLDYHARRLEQREIPEPGITAVGQVLLRVREVGVCGTDRELAGFRHGHPPAGSSFLVIGHEALGEVVECGPAVRGLAPGDLVVSMIRRGCEPPCSSCARGRRDLCVSGRHTERGIFGAAGYFADWAVDDAADLVRVPPSLADVAVLAEPLSVVEKAVERALRLYEGEPATAVVLGAGPLGILSALALQARGLSVTLASLQSRDDPRAGLVEGAGIAYVEAHSAPRADIVFEATGSPAAGFQAISLMTPMGVCAVLGSRDGVGPVSFRSLVLGNQTVFGSVNSSPESFAAAVRDLERFDRRVLAGMILRVGFEEFAESLVGSRYPGAVKVVHRL